MTGKEENTILNLRGSIRAAAVAVAAQSVVTPLNCNTLSSNTRACPLGTTFGRHCLFYVFVWKTHTNRCLLMASSVLIALA